MEDPNIPPAEPGSLRDLSSDARTQLVVHTLMRLMANRGYREQGTTPGALFSFPAWELIRIYPQNVPRRPSWPDRWREAGGELHGGRMIARKDDKIWAALGDRALFDDAIGTDYPPFAFNSGMGWRQVPRNVCKRFGITVDDIKVPEAATLEATRLSVKGIDREFLKGLREALDVGNQGGLCAIETGGAGTLARGYRMSIGLRITVHSEQVEAFLQRFHGGLTDRIGLHSEIPARAADELEGVKR